jgi:4-amino-4-deoxy-L-arabinose transferase-like glycosyltransferase
VAAFFVLLGATNLAKGVIFGTAMAGLPIASYLLCNRSWAQIRRYVWLWGWLLAAGVAIAWPLLAIGRYPEIIDLWKEHYGGRLNKGYLQEAWWYYLAFTPHVLLPWTVPALIGLWNTRREAFAGPGRERFLWCCAIVPPAVFSLSDGKHHHYLLQCMAPWAVFAALGTRSIWQFCRDKFPQWSKDPILAAAIWGVGAVVTLVSLRDKIPGELSVLVAFGAFVPAAAFVASRSLFHPNPRIAFAGVLAVLSVGYGMWTTYQVHYLDKYDDDLEFVREASRRIPADSPVFMEFDWIAPLETFWMLYHSPRPGVTIRDPWQLAERLPGKDCAYILTRRYEIENFTRVGTVDVVLESRQTRCEKDLSERRVLCRVTFSRSIPPAPEGYIRYARRTLW